MPKIKTNNPIKLNPGFKISRNYTYTKRLIDSLFYSINEQINNEVFKPKYFISINYKRKCYSSTIIQHHNKIKTKLLTTYYKVNKPKKLELIFNKPKFLFTYELNSLNKFHTHLLLEHIPDMTSSELESYLFTHIDYDFLDYSKFRFSVIDFNYERHAKYILKSTSSTHCPIDIFNSDLW